VSESVADVSRRTECDGYLKDNCRPAWGGYQKAPAQGPAPATFGILLISCGLIPRRLRRSHHNLILFPNTPLLAAGFFIRVNLVQKIPLISHSVNFVKIQRRS